MQSRCNRKPICNMKKKHVQVCSYFDPRYQTAGNAKPRTSTRAEAKQFMVGFILVVQRPVNLLPELVSPTEYQCALATMPTCGNFDVFSLNCNFVFVTCTRGRT
eukprot:m.77367 g.77367  ORF g.77367 m.77367 type:complete len:104 (+) comp12506_c0_seq8:3550-3861(+)